MNALTRYGLVFAIVLQLLIYVWIARLSSAFEFQASATARPIVLVLSLLAINFGLHLVSMFALLKHAPGKRLLVWVISVSLAMRCIMLVSTPIQEVDIYRYIWDGIVATQGVNPFRYSPQQLSEALEASSFDPAPGRSQGVDWEQRNAVQSLLSLVAFDTGIHETLNRVHYPELRTVYPPTSQAVFAAVALVTPEQVPLETRVAIMKMMIVLFDVGAIILLWRLTTALGIHPAWTIAYAWSPLILKEFANSGHLDAIAVFFMLSSLTALVAVNIGPRQKWAVWGSGLLLAMAVGAKLFPIVVAPLMGVFLYRQRGARATFTWMLIFTAMTLATLAPMLTGTDAHANHLIRPQTERVEPPTKIVLAKPQEDGLSGLTTFLTRWEMNDLIFMVVEENLRPHPAGATSEPLWFVFVPNDYRIKLVQAIAQRTGLAAARIPFLMARVLTLITFGMLTVWLSWRVWQQPEWILTACFLSLAWFWLLAPTQNPWYWSWALCLIPFARSRIWLAVGGVTMLYYLRFWFQYHFDGETVWGSPYMGAHFFDFVIVWVEFGPVLVALTISLVVRLLARRTGPAKHTSDAIPSA